METFFPVLGILYWAINEAVFFSPGTEDAAASLFVSCPRGIEKRTVGCGSLWRGECSAVYPGEGTSIDLVRFSRRLPALSVRQCEVQFTGSESSYVEACDY